MVEVIERSTALVLLRPGRAADFGAFRVGLPAMGRFVEAGGLLLARVAPHQVLAMREGVAPLVEELSVLGPAVGLVDLSDSRVAVRVRGAGLSQLVPVDLHPSRFGPGCCAATMMAHLAVLLLQLGDDVYELQCGRSFVGSFMRAFAHEAA